MAKKVLTILIIVIAAIVAIFILWSFLTPSVTYVGDQNTNINNEISNQEPIRVYAVAQDFDIQPKWKDFGLS